MNGPLIRRAAARIRSRPTAAIVRGVRIAGIWGYSQETELAGQVNDAGFTDTDTTVTLDAGSDIEKGETILIGTEQLYVSDVQAVALTVQRGINGTTAAAHADDTAVYRRLYPLEVVEACKIAVVAGRWRSQSGYGGSVPDDPGMGRKPQWKYDWESRLAGFSYPTVV